MSLFGFPPKPAGALGQVQTTTSTPTTSAPSFGGSLFGSSISGAQPQQQQGQQGQAGQNGSSLFGQPAQTQQPANNTPLAGAPSGLGGSLFGSAPAQQQQPPPGPLSQSALPQQSRFGGFGQASNVQSPQIQQPLNGSTTAHFSTLLERSKKRKGQHDGPGDFATLPSLHLGLDDIASKVGVLGGGDAPTRLGTRRARDLLAASGVPRGATVNDLGSFTSLPLQAAPIQSNIIDIDAHVANLRAKSAQDLINESLEQAKRDFNTFIEENIQINWQEQRRRIHEHFGIIKPTSGDTQPPAGSRGFGTSVGPFGSPAKSFGPNMSRSVLGGSVSRGPSRLSNEPGPSTSLVPPVWASDDALLRTKQDRYAAKVRQLNIARKQDAPFSIVEEFGRAEVEAGGDAAEHLVDAFRALKAICKERSLETSDTASPRPRQFSSDYLEANASSPQALAIRKQIIDGSRAFLETSFFDDVETAVARSPQEASLGGVPSKINKVRGYIRIKAARKDLAGEGSELQMVGDDYCWALIYHLLRAGLVAEAADYVASNARAIRVLDRSFAEYMAAYARDPDRRLPRDMQTKINGAYSQRSKLAVDNSIDPYRMACYKVIGRCDLAHKNLEDVSFGMKDWLWLLFSLAREVNRLEETASEYFGLEDARTLIEQIGQRHFAPGGDNAGSYATYFLMQVLGGLFEKAVAYLYPQNYVTAVHFAIALDYYGLLRVAEADADADLLSVNARGLPQLSFARMLGYYTRDFRIARPETATDYLVLICLDADLPGGVGAVHARVCQQALRELVLETRDFALLLGDVRVNGQRISGAIEERLPLIDTTGNDDLLRTLTVQAAALADNAGRTTDAVLLYHLAEDYDSVVKIINQALSDLLAADSGADALNMEPAREHDRPPSSADQDSTLSLTAVSDPEKLAQNMIGLYNANALYFRKIRDMNRTACGKLLRLAKVRAHVLAGRSSQALDDAIDLGILPLRADGNMAVVRSLAQGFALLPGPVARCLPNLLVWVVACLGKERKKLSESPFVANRAAGDALLQAAQDCMAFAGLMRYKLPADVFEVLARAGLGLG